MGKKIQEFRWAERKIK